MTDAIRKVRILGIETSCDETAAAIVEDGRLPLTSLVASQIDIHRRFGGVVPEVASRKHIEVISGLVRDTFVSAGLEYGEIDAVAVTNCPGLIGALLVGMSFAKGLAYGLGKPLIAVNHLKAHIYANYLGEQDPRFPAVCLVVSGGHTSLLYMPDHRHMEVMGETRDDAAGEAFDKVARFLGLGYPGGPAVQKAAALGRPGVYRLPRVFLDREDFEFSFSGLKTASMNLWNRIRREEETPGAENLAAEFQEALVDVLVEKTIRAARVRKVKNILLAGGVAANLRLREQLGQAAGDAGLTLNVPPPVLCTDNAAMVASAGYFQFIERDYAGLDLNAYPSFEFAVQKTCG